MKHILIKTLFVFLTVICSFQQTNAQTITLSHSSILFSNNLVNTQAVIPFTVAGSGLTGAPSTLTVTAPSGFLVSTNATSGFASSASVSFSSATLAATKVYVAFTPTSTSAVSAANITITGGGAASVNLAVSSTGGITTFGAPSSILYRTISGSSSWNSVSTWEISNDGGSTWSAASTVPSGNENIYIQPTSSVTLNAAPVITGYLKNNGIITMSATTSSNLTATNGSENVTLSAANASIVTGQLISTRTGSAFPAGVSVVNVSGTTVTLSQKAIGNIATAISISFYSNYFTFSSGSTYEHAQDGGELPIGSWASTSTCLISGCTVTVPSANSFYTSQNFGNFTWDCVNQVTASLTMGWGGMIITGNVFFKNTGTTGVGGGNSNGTVRITSATPYSNSTITSVPITINGNLTLGTTTTLGKAFLSGSSGLQVYNTTVKGDVYVGTAALGGSALGISGGSGGPGIFTLTGSNGNGDFIVAGTGSTISANNASKVIFAKAGTQTFSYPTNVSLGLTWEVSNGTTLNLGSQIIGGVGGFIMNTGSTLISSISTFSTSGSFNVATASKSISSGASFILNGSIAQTLSFPTSSSVLANNNTTATTSSTAVTLSVANSNIKVGQIVTGTGISASGTTTVAAISGTALTLSQAATLAANAALTFTDPATISNQSIANLTINNTNGVTISTLPVSITGVLTLNNGTLNIGSGLTLKSNSTSTARVAPITGTGAISGSVTVECFIPGGRRTSRFLSHPFSNTLDMSSLIDNIYITGGNYLTGFDSTATQNPSSFWFDNTTQSWKAFTSTTDANWTQYRGIRVLIRGDRTQPTTLTGANPTPNQVTLDMAGNLNTGVQNIPVPTGYSVLGNPYPSPVDIGTRIDALTNTVIGNQYWVWDARGGLSAGSYITKVVGSGAYNLAMNGAFVVSPISATSLSFIESDKQTSATSNLFRTSNSSNQIELQVLYNNYPIDNMFIRFNSSASDSQESLDGEKLLNPEVNFYTLSSDSKKLSLDVRSFANNKIIPLGFTSTQSDTFKLRVADIGIVDDVYLKDKYLNTTTQLLPNTEYIFTVNSAIPATQGENRFEIVLKTNSALPVTFLQLSASQKSNGIEVNFITANEFNMNIYEIEKSTDGLAFTKSVTLLAKNGLNNTYNWLDMNVVNGDNYYRIKSVDKNGVNKHSNIVKVRIGEKASAFVIYPNPVKGSVIGLQMIDIEKSIYNVRVFSNSGQEISNHTINHNGGSATHTIDIGKMLPVGTYKMHISNGTNNITKTVIVE